MAVFLIAFDFADLSCLYLQQKKNLIVDIHFLCLKRKIFISEESYNNLMENIYVMGNKENYDWLMKGKAQLENGQYSVHELSEAEDNE